jgi:cellulose synthase/poly-beta-1,6-N-acetylglucosamine synthase-like glycosyltransferase
VILLLLCLWFLLLAVYPFVLYPLSLRLLVRASMARRHPSPAATASCASDIPPTAPTFAVCVCAYNEEAVIERKVRNMLALREQVGALDILVYVDAATDRTAELLEAFRDRIEVVVSPERRGKTHGMNLLVSRTNADIVVFTDANVLMHQEAIAALARRFADPRIGCVCGHLVYRNARTTATARVGSGYWSLEEMIKRDESVLGAVMGADGSLFAIRRSLHRPVPPNLIDDMYLSLGILCDGYEVVRAEDALAYEDSVTASGEEFRRKMRIACQAFNVHRMLWPRLTRLPALKLYMYVSHKLLRWFAGLNLLLSAAFGGAFLVAHGMPIFAVPCLALAGISLLWLGVSHSIPLLAPAAEILLAFLGTLAGVVQSLRGRQFQTWTPAASIRPTSGRR